MGDINNGNFELSAKIEALLFVHGEEINLKRLADILKCGEDDVRNAVIELKKELDEQNRGLTVILNSDRAMLVTRPDLSEFVKELVRKEFDANLTSASLETLSLIAYLGPVSRAEIEYIRGVNSSFILRNLLVRGLITKEADKSIKGSVVYDVTFDFLRHVGVNSKEELPEFEKYRDLIRNKSNQNDGEEEN